MRWLVLGLAVAGVLCLLAGRHIDRTAGSEDDALACLIPYVAGAALLAIDALLLAVLVIVKALA